jgi:hypothetical protein
MKTKTKVLLWTGGIIGSAIGATVYAGKQFFSAFHPVKAGTYAMILLLTGSYLANTPMDPKDKDSTLFCKAKHSILGRTDVEENAVRIKLEQQVLDSLKHVDDSLRFHYASAQNAINARYYPDQTSIDSLIAKAENRNQELKTTLEYSAQLKNNNIAFETTALVTEQKYNPGGKIIIYRVSDVKGKYFAYTYDQEDEFAEKDLKLPKRDEGGNNASELTWPALFDRSKKKYGSFEKMVLSIINSNPNAGKEVAPGLKSLIIDYDFEYDLGWEYRLYHYSISNNCVMDPVVGLSEEKTNNTHSAREKILYSIKR